MTSIGCEDNLLIHLPFLLSDPYEQVVLPVDGLKEEEPVEPYQKIGPSKIVWCTLGTQISVHKIQFGMLIGLV